MTSTEPAVSARDFPATTIVLTYRRPRLASQAVRGLLNHEGVPASRVVLVVNGDGGLDDPKLEAAIRVLRLEENVGPAGGFARAFVFVRDTMDAPWLFACEDDFDLSQGPALGLQDMIERVEAFERAVPGPPVGVVVGGQSWDMDRRTGLTWRHEFRGAGFDEVGYGGWGGSTLISRKVLDAGVLPDESLFWWAEDLDFCLRVREAGFRVLADAAISTRAVLASRVPPRDFPGRREEPWCSYYEARNPFILRRRFGSARWTFWHLLKSVRRFQLAPSNAHRAALLRGLADGLRGRTGKNSAFVRDVGEW